VAVGWNFLAASQRRWHCARIWFECRPCRRTENGESRTRQERSISL
jgi:hypothetical protein